MAKISKGQSYYRVAEDPAFSCATCKHFQPRQGTANGLCALVTGIVEPEDTCDLWEKQSAPAGWAIGALAAVGLLWLFSRR